MIRKIFYPLVLLTFGFFALVNVSSFQSLPSLFFNLVNNQKKSDAVLFLKKIKGAEEFPQQLQYFKKIYGGEIEKEVFADEIKRKEEIKNLETILQKNEKARDVLVKLAILYFESNDINKAKKYYQRAKEVDPQIKIKQIDGLLR